MQMQVQNVQVQNAPAQMQTSRSFRATQPFRNITFSLRSEQYGSCAGAYALVCQFMFASSSLI